MDAKKIITLVDREFEISKRYNEHTDESEYITDISLTDLTGCIWTDEGVQTSDTTCTESCITV
jgi:hypothetical protein